MEAVSEQQLSDYEIATRALAMRDDPFFKEILRTMKKEAIEAWANSRKTEAREDVWHSLQAIDRLEKTVTRYADVALVERRKAEAKRIRDEARKPKAPG